MDRSSHGDGKILNSLCPLMSSPAESSQLLQVEAQSNYASYPVALEEESAISTEDFELLHASTMLNTLDAQEILLPGLVGGPTSSAMGINCHDVFTPGLEHPERWSLNSEPLFSAWKEAHDYPSTIGENPSFLHHHEPKSQHQHKSKRSDAKDMAESSKAGVSVPVRVDKPTKLPVFRSSNAAIDLRRQFDSSDNSDAMEDDEGGKLSFNGKIPSSKNLVSERMRRKRLNERLYSLRALVPMISKMDKASIVSDAITYVQDLQKQVEDLQADILILQSNKDALLMELHDSRDSAKAIVGRILPRRNIPKHQILELEVTEMEEHTYHLRLHCKKGPGVLVQLTQALESLDFEIVNANLTSITDHILNTIVLKVKNGERFKTDELRKLILDVVPNFGLHI